MKNSWAQARVLDASDRAYLEAVLSLLDHAKKEIVISLYLIEPQDKAGPFYSVNRLVESLLRARQRDVQVRIYLNTNFRFRPKTEVGEGTYFEKLIQAGIELTALLPSRRLHDKLIVIDGRYVVEGSTNWSVSALESNFESVSIIDSRAHAKKKLNRIAQLTLPSPAKQPEINRPLSPIPNTIEIPVGLFDQNFLPKMIRKSDWRTMDLYFILLGQSQAQKKDLIEVDLETMGRALGFPAEWNRSEIRRQVLKILRKLTERYQLIEVKFAYAKDAQVEIKKLPGETIRVPGTLFEASSLSKPSGITFLTLAREVLKREGIDIDTLSAAAIEDRFGGGRSTVIRSRAAAKL